MSKKKRQEKSSYNKIPKKNEKENENQDIIEENESKGTLAIKEIQQMTEVKTPEKLSLVEKAERKKRKNIYIIINLVIIVILIGVFSIIFALLNSGKGVIINGISIKGIDVSNLTIAEATKKLEEALSIELNTSIKITAQDYETTLNSSQIEFEYIINKAVEEAYSLGRSSNIIKNNYTILFATFSGKEIEITYEYNEETLNYIVDNIEAKMPGLVVEASYYIEGEELIIIPGTDGIIVEKDKLKEDIINKILSLNAYDILENNNTEQLEVPVSEVVAAPIDIDQIYQEVFTEPQDAYYEEEPFKIYVDIDGVDFGISIDEAKQLISEEATEYRIPLTITPASKTINDIGTEAFRYEISNFTTKYDASNKNRSQNLEIAAGKINGMVLMPGEEFSFNQVVGKRTIEEGYKEAKIYQNGQVVDGLAGGICQISSTLYNAVVEANLEITERKNHSFTTSYVPAGKDATVVYGVIDFKFKNTRTYPIKIVAEVSSGIASFTIYGIEEETEYDIRLTPVVTTSIPYTTQYITDTTLATGQRVVQQAGSNGCKVSTYKETRLDGQLVSKELVSTDTYNSMTEIIRIGP